MRELKLKSLFFAFYQIIVLLVFVLRASATPSASASASTSSSSINPVFSSSKSRLQNIQGKKLNNASNLTQIVRIVESPRQSLNVDSTSANLNDGGNRKSVISTFTNGGGINVVAGTTTKVNLTGSSSTDTNKRKDIFRNQDNAKSGDNTVRVSFNSDTVYTGTSNGNIPYDELTTKRSYTNKPSPSGKYYLPFPKPTPAYGAKPTQSVPVPATTSTSTTTTTTEPISTPESVTSIIVTPTEKPVETSSTTLTPVLTTTVSTENGEIEGEDEDYDDVDSVSLRESTKHKSIRWPSLPVGTGVGRSRTTTLDGKTLKTTTKKPLQPLRSLGRSLNSRAMKLNKEEESDVVTDFVFSNIKCFRTQHREYFGASIHMKRGFHLPYIRDRPQDPLTSTECKMQRLDTPNAYHINITDLKGCGVEQCGDSYCLTMVFPRVPTLALADDEVTTIKCEPQKSAISEVRSISFAGDTLENRRSSSTVEGGGQDFAAEVGVFRQNPGTSNGLFVKRVNSGGVVQLGEPLQLRSVVRGGDGWSHSKLTDVKVWRMKDSHPQNYDTLNPMDASEVITLVDARGCRNNEYEVIAESHPLRDPRNNLVHHFTFRAFLFRGQRPNEPLIVTAKVQACQEGGECQTSDCDGGARKNKDPNVNRFKRSIMGENTDNSPIRDFSSQLALRVVGLQDDAVSVTQEDFTDNSQQISHPISSLSSSCTEKMAFSAVAGGAIVLLLGGLVFSLIFFSFSSKKSKLSQNSDNGPSLCDTNMTMTSPTTTTPTNDFSDNKLSWNKTPKDSFHTNAIRKQNKPLPPPPPMDYPELRFGLNGNKVSSVSAHPCSSNSEKQVEHVAKILHQLNAVENEDPSEYECIENPRENKIQVGSKNDGVVIFYCYNNDKKWNSASAPSSLREKKRNRKKILRYQLEDPGETEESDGSFDKHHKFSQPRTVRSIKKIQSKKRAGGGIRRRLSSIYREVYQTRCRAGSFPARIPATYDHGSYRRKSILSRDKDCSDIYSDAFGNYASEWDSAYCGSARSKMKQQGYRSVRTLEGIFPASEKITSYYHDHRKVFKDAVPSSKDSALPLSDFGAVPDVGQSECIPMLTAQGSVPLLNSTSVTNVPNHILTRNDTSTQIIIIPETNV